MKYFETRFIRVGTLAAVMVSSLALHAADPIEVKWNQVCQVAGSRQLLVTTANGDKIEGACVSIDVNEMRVTTKDRKVVRIARRTLSKLELQRRNGHQLRSLRAGMRQGLRTGFSALFSPWAPGGMAIVPATLAWGAVAAPFCLLGDLGAKAMGTQEIKPI